jgi:hypothetical protein
VVGAPDRKQFMLSSPAIRHERNDGDATMSHNTHGQNDNNGARGDVGAATASSMCSLLLFLV